MLRFMCGEYWSSRKGIGCLRWRHVPAFVYASTIITVPAMGDSVTEGTIAAILKAPGPVNGVCLTFVDENVCQGID